jgi:hypothetical protein
MDGLSVPLPFLIITIPIDGFFKKMDAMKPDYRDLLKSIIST